MLELITQQLANGLVLGSTYALVALGLTLVFGVLLIPNFAHGEFYMAGAFITYTLAMSGVNFWVAMVLSVMLVMLLGCLIDRLAFFPIRTAPALSLMISALAMSIILQQIATIIWGTEARTIPTPLPGVIRTTYFAITYLQLAILLSLAIAALAVWMILYHSRLGLAIRATAQNRDAAALMGIRMSVVRTSTFAISAALGAIAGALLGATFPIYPTMGSIPVLKAFVVLVLGGIGSFWGAILGGLFLGTSEVFVAGYISSQLQDIGTFLLLTMVLLVRPQGLFGRVNMER